MNVTETLRQKIPFGRKNAVRRETLSTELGMDDRSIRRLIAKANKNGLYIINLGDSGQAKGYYQPDSMDEKFSYYKKERAAAISRLSKLKPLRRDLKEAGYTV